MSIASGFYGRQALLPQTKIWLSQLTVKPSISYTNAVNKLIRQLVIDNNWNSLDRFWIFATEQKQHAQICIKSLSSLTEVSSPSWVANRGYTGNGTTSYLNTNFRPYLDGTNWTPKTPAVGAPYSEAFGIYSRTESQSTGCDIGTNQGGVQGSSRYQLFIRNTSDLITVGLAANASDTKTLTSSLGLISGCRNDTTTVEFWARGISLGTATRTAVGFPGATTTSKAAICCSRPDLPNSFTTRQYSMAYFGNSSIDQLKLYNAFQTFATTIGFNV